MARLQKDIVNYFPHDANASNGDTLTILQSQFGNNGYAVWFKLLEKLASTDGHYLDCNNPIKWRLLVAFLGTDEITTVEIIKLLVEMRAIDKDLWDKKLIWCQKLVENVADVYKNRRRELPQKPFSTNHNEITTVETPITTARGTQSKVKESKVNKNKVYGEFKNVLLSEEENQKLLEKYGEKATGVMIETLSAYMKSKNKRYSSHYAALLNWFRKDESNGKNRGDSRLAETREWKPATGEELAELERLRQEPD